MYEELVLVSVRPLYSHAPATAIESNTINEANHEENLLCTNSSLGNAIQQWLPLPCRYQGRYTGCARMRMVSIPAKCLAFKRV